MLFTVALVVPGVPARADNSNNFLGQAQRFLNNGDNDRDSYERGRQDEMRRQQNGTGQRPLSPR
jgi:hypothetical protein